MVLTFQLADDVVSTLRNVLLSRGFVEFVPGVHAAHTCNFQWKTTRYSEGDAAGTPLEQAAGRARDVRHRQRINHFQKTSGICTKDCLARSLRRMSKTWGALYSFSPETFILPREATDLSAAIEAAAADAAARGLPPVAWICKPSASSQGKNIFIIHSVAELIYDCSFVVQRYISSPMLIGGYKYDLRVYVLVTSFRPLSVLLYREGLVRFSSAKYDPSDTSNLFSHLTNASINKESPELDTVKDVVGPGCKWTIRGQWFQYLQQHCGVNPMYIWEQIKDIVLLTLLPIVGEVVQNPRSFELLGFDVMLDSALKPWIIEVNASPALAISGAVDTQVKIPLINDMIEAIGFTQEEGWGQRESGHNVLTAGQAGFDPRAQRKADAASVAAAHAAAAHAAAAASGGAIATSAVSGGVPSTISGRGDRVQRVPRLVKLQSTRPVPSLPSLAATSTALAPSSCSSSSSSPALHPPHTRRPANDHSAIASRIPRMPSSSPARRSPPLSHEGATAGASPSKIPVRANGGQNASTLSTDKQRTTTLKQPRASIARERPTLPSAPSVAPAPRRTVARVSSASAKLPPASTSAPTAARGRSRVPSAPAVSIAAAAATSTAALPALVGDFERIFPFDAVTATASDTLATPASAGKSSGSVGSTGPSPLVLAAFSKSVVTGLKARIRERERTHAERRRAREQDASLPLCQSFCTSSDLPSPWTPEAIAAAVERAKVAARNERARLGLPEQQAGGEETTANEAEEGGHAVQAQRQEEDQHEEEQREEEGESDLPSSSSAPAAAADAQLLPDHDAQLPLPADADAVLAS